MIKTAISTYDEFRALTPPPLRRSSRDPEREENFKEIVNVEIFYKTRTNKIKHVVETLNKYKKIKSISAIIQNLFVQKYGDNFGTILTKIIMEDYLGVKDNTTEWFPFWYSKKGEHPCFYDTTSDELYHKLMLREDVLGLEMDPRIRTYDITQVTPYMKNGYSIICSFMGGTNNWRILAKSRKPNHINEQYYWSDDDAEILATAYY